MAKSTTLIHLEEQLKWAYEGSMYLNGKTDWAKANQIEAEIKALKRG